MPAAASNPPLARAPRRGLDILFSRKDDWEPPLREAFRGTPHRITFDTFTAHNLAAHDLAVPLTIADAKLACDAPVAERSLLPLPSRPCIDTLDDKLQFHRAMVAAGFGQYVPPVSEQPFLPYIVKRRIDECGVHTCIVGSFARERALAAECSSPDYFRQELVPGNREYATHIVYDERGIRFSLTIEYLFANDFFVKGQAHCERATPVPAPGCMDVFAQILAALDFRGLCCINYKLVDGIPMIFEINPRCGFSLCAYFPQVLDALQQRWWQPLARAFAPPRTTLR
jgi:hypothetical protein